VIEEGAIMQILRQILFISISLVVTAAFSTGSVVAQQTDAWTKCVNKEKAPRDVQISGCSTVIQSSQETPENLAVAFYNRGLAYYVIDKIDLSIADYTEAIRLNPKNARSWNNRCVSRTVAGRLQQALTDCNESLRLLPNQSNVLDSRGFTYLKLGQFDLAVADYNSALQLNPRIASSLFGRGIVKLKKSDIAGSTADIAAAKRIKSDIADELARYRTAALTDPEERALKSKIGFKECENCPEMVVVPAGLFSMGSPENEAGRDEDESPQHPVTISRPFAVGKFEVTVDQFAAFVADTGYNASSKCWPFAEGQADERLDRSWRNPNFGGNHPVVCVNWNDAKAYVAWLTNKTGKSYRLLTEAEWEYSARAGTTTAYNFGNEENAQCGNGTSANLTVKSSVPAASSWPTVSCSDFLANIVPVGSLAANAFGLHDMHGNVWEWTEDCYKKSYNGAPADGSAWIGGDCSHRVLRGGSWDGNPRSLRSAYRSGNSIDNRDHFLGFRIARTLNP
jgi:formylglycine-generating enzyme required for sulfatase activity/lipoprotein NlpI